MHISISPEPYLPSWSKNDPEVRQEILRVDSNGIPLNLILARRAKLHLCHANVDFTPARHHRWSDVSTYHKLLRLNRECANVASHTKLGLCLERWGFFFCSYWQGGVRGGEFCWSKADFIACWEWRRMVWLDLCNALRSSTMYSWRPTIPGRERVGN